MKNTESGHNLNALVKQIVGEYSLVRVSFKKPRLSWFQVYSDRLVWEGQA